MLCNLLGRKLPQEVRSQESGARSQNGFDVRIQQPTDFFQQAHQFVGVTVAQVFAMFMKRVLSAGPRLRNPSAMLAGIETAARRIWCDKP